MREQSVDESRQVLTSLAWTATGECLSQETLSAWCDYTGQRAEKTTAWGWLSALHPDDAVQVMQAWAHAVQTKKSFTLSCRIKGWDRVYRHFRMQAVPIFDLDYAVSEWISIFSQPNEGSAFEEQEPTTHSLYHLLFEQAATGIYSLTLDGHFALTNPEFCKIIGYTQDELKSLHVRDIEYAEDLSSTFEALRTLLLGKQAAVILQKRYIRKGGSIIWVRVKATLLRTPEGLVHSYLVFVEDITRRKQIEEERAQLLIREQHMRAQALLQAQELGAIFDSMVDSVIVYDREGYILRANTAARELFDFRAEHFEMPLEKRLQRLGLWDEQQGVLDEDAWPVKRILRGEVLRDDQAVEIGMTLPSGQKIYAGVTGSPMWDENGKIIGGVLVIRNVTRHHQLEHRVQEAFNTLLTVVKELVTIIGHDISTEEVDEKGALAVIRSVGTRLATLIYHALSCRFVGISLIEPETENLRPLAIVGPPPEVIEEIRKSIGGKKLTYFYDRQTIKTLQANEVLIGDLDLMQASRPDQEFHLSNLLTAPMLIGGRLAGVIGVEKEKSGQEYTPEEIALVKAIATLVLLVIERERLQQDWLRSHAQERILQEINRRFDEFLGIASHELRTPLTTIKGNLQLALRRLEKFQQREAKAGREMETELVRIREPLQGADHRVNVQSRMISDLLDVSRIRANTFSIVVQPCDLRAIVRGAVEDQRAMAPERSIILKLPEQETVPICADADRIGQVVNNYLTNALKYSPAEKPVYVELECTDERARVSVRDEGPGLSPEEQKHVWERFYRVKRVVAQNGEKTGLGLGLHICRIIIERHKGTFGLTSEQGQGSTFWFELPLAPPKCEEAPQR